VSKIGSFPYANILGRIAAPWDEMEARISNLSDTFLSPNLQKRHLFDWVPFVVSHRRFFR